MTELERWRAAHARSLCAHGNPTGQCHTCSAQPRAALTDVALRALLEAKLRVVEAGYAGIQAVDASEGTVVYDCFEPAGLRTFQRAFEVQADGSVVLGDERVSVVAQTAYVAASARDFRPYDVHLAAHRLAEGRAPMHALIDDMLRPWDIAMRRRQVRR
jgi:hypothetical protein